MGKSTSGSTSKPTKLQDFSRGLFKKKGNFLNSSAKTAGMLTRKAVGKSLQGAAVLGAGKLVGDRLDKLDDDISVYESYWEKRLGHKGVPTIEDYQHRGDEAETEWEEDYKNYWETRPLDMEWR